MGKTYRGSRCGLDGLGCPVGVASDTDFGSRMAELPDWTASGPKTGPRKTSTGRQGFRGEVENQPIISFSKDQSPN